jgi:Raf kinase inhibitor-like YbhB/YbcL family protein
MAPPTLAAARRADAEARSRQLPDCESRAAGSGERMAQELRVGDLRVRSRAFAHHERIPTRHAAEGEDVAPPLEWSGAPEGTRAYAIVVHDPDAPLVDGFTHWVAYGIPAERTSLGEGDSEVVAGANSLGHNGYNGPTPPRGHGTHHYYFWVYALDDDLDLEPGLDRRALLERIEDHVLEQARLIGTYSS